MGNTEEQPQAPGAPETAGAADPADVNDRPKGATPSTPGYEATRQQVDEARDEVDGTDNSAGGDAADDAADPDATR